MREIISYKNIFMFAFSVGYLFGYMDQENILCLAWKHFATNLFSRNILFGRVFQ